MAQPPTKPLPLYERVRDYIDTGDRLEWHSETTLGYTIRARTGDWSNHTSGVIRLHSFETDAYDSIFAAEALEDGFDFNRLRRRLREFEGGVRWYSLLPQYRHLREEIGQIYIDYEGIPYDYDSLALSLFVRVEGDKEKVFCSEGVWLAGKEAGLPSRRLTAPWPGSDMDRLGWWGDGITIL
jgi:hypothetical protein